MKKNFNLTVSWEGVVVSKCLGAAHRRIELFINPPFFHTVGKLVTRATGNGKWLYIVYMSYSSNNLYF